ncbi:MAG: hypothetical protein UU29_C0008G0100 [Candidatus Daviesbacteria bacterium GW2011_GWA2_40_9]|uniref:DUF4012 domain-containing protein n=1 Tax=Candidatus Daviesbacteria bacterium GW2011_GWA2_40_9 TaxID=1618424 RepID=A0A0G0U706_9BACT|nr:MAG: hypothetical protein UU29_C0008G0100 [Candidatus Daviesbacteria bacterium GW2011_GWA2_40_9]
MPFINLNKKIDGVGKKNSSSPERKGKGWLIRLVIIFIILFVLIYLPARSIYQSTKQVMQSSRQIILGAKQENLDLVRQGVVDTQKSVSSLNGALNFFFWMRALPFVGGFYSDAKHFVTAFEYELEAVKILTDSLEPYKNEIGLTGQGTPGQDRVAQAVKILDKTLPSLDKVEPFLKKARREIESVDTGKYPENFGSKKLRGRIEEAKNFIVGADIAVSENKGLIEVLPELLGQKGAKNYLLLFQNDKELRATGGFITAYAFFVKYLPEADGKPRSAWSMRDSNLSPDLPTSLQQFERMYEMLGDGISFDGIFTIDTQVVEELIAVTGPIDVLGTTYSAEKDKRCNCPNVIYELEHYAEITAKGESDRKAILGALMQQLMAKLLTLGPDQLPTLLNTTIKLANDKHLMAYMHNGKIQQSFSKLNWTGEIKRDPEGDYLHLNDSNFAGGKSNLYVDEKVTLEITTTKDGSAKHKITIEYKNPQPYNTWLNGILRDYVRIFVPKGSVLTDSKGSAEKVTTALDNDLNKIYFEAFVVVRPQNSLTLSLEYTSPVKVTEKNYPLLIQKQPGAKNHKYIVKINGNKKAEFDLTSDKQLDLTF